jgi:CelD/BcsL family acetyltransferase involved in cellulose biosynthesis
VSPADGGDAVECPVNWSGVPYECSLVAGPDSLAKLRVIWDELLERARDARLSEGADWAEVCWRARPASAGKRLLALVVRHGTHAVAILPLVVERRGLFRVARPLACRTTEYSPLLVDPSADVQRVWSALADGVRDLAAVDAIVLPYVRDDGALTPALRAAPGVVETDAILNRFLRRTAFDSWERYRDRLPNQVKSNLKRARRRLGQLGELRFEELTAPEDRRAAWRWMLCAKRAWLARKGLDHVFIPTEDYARFMEATLDIAAPAGRRAIFALKLDGALVAAELVNVDRRRVELFVCTYDPAYAQHAPGNVLREEVVRWAFAHGLDYDWRLGDEPYKQDWASDASMARTYVLGRNRRGRLFAAYMAAHTWLAYRTPKRLRARIRALLRSLGR